MILFMICNTVIRAHNPSYYFKKVVLACQTGLNM